MTRIVHGLGPALALVVLLAGVAAPRASASPVITGPTVTLSSSEVQVGDRVLVTIDGFAAPIVTITVCGNRALHGSPDCNMTAGKGVKLDAAGTPTVAQFAVQAPPAPCPCVVRVSSRANEEVATTPITLVGHPTAPVDDSAAGADLGDALAVSVSAVEATDGVLSRLRFELGGPGTYAVTMKFTNRSAVALGGIAVFGSVGRGSTDDLVVIELSEPGVLQPGQTWEQTVRVKVPGPTLGALRWRFTTTRDGKSVTAITSTRHRPVLLVVVAMLLVLDLAMVAMRALVRRRAARELAAADGPVAEPRGENVAPAI